MLNKAIVYLLVYQTLFNQREKNRKKMLTVGNILFQCQFDFKMYLAKNTENGCLKAECLSLNKESSGL